jgi:3-methylcrotonyl-CoA carboxylase alpha subunit
MREAGLPVVPGYQGDDQSAVRLERMAATVGFPLLVKAVAGGGGKGMRPVHSPDAFLEALLAAQREARAAFGNDAVMLERLIGTPRHVEVQIMGDAHGNVVHLFERDCSVQRRHQKVLEEAPAPGLSPRLRQTLGIAAVTAGMAIGYCNAGTVEFILDMDDPDEAGDPRFYFMEMNTRLQVEHPVTEMVTGLDLVEWQLRIARGEMLPLMQEAIDLSGHAIEARLYAENPQAGFLPSTGRIGRLSFAEGPGLRVDAGVAEGGEVTIHYDPMIAKLIAHGATREEAIDRLVAALDRVEVEGLATNRAFLARLAAQPAFRAADLDTGFIPRHEAALFAPAEPTPERVAAIALALAPLATGATGFAAPFRLNARMRVDGGLWNGDGAMWKTCVLGEGPAREVRVDGVPATPAADVVLVIDPDGVSLRHAGETLAFLRHDPAADAGEATGDGQVLAPMPGKVLQVDVGVGDQVAAGDRLMVLEAMKMEHRLTAPLSGTVELVAVAAGDQVAQDRLLVRIAPADGV